MKSSTNSISKECEDRIEELLNSCMVGAIYKELPTVSNKGKGFAKFYDPKINKYISVTIRIS